MGTGAGGLPVGLGLAHAATGSAASALHSLEAEEPVILGHLSHALFLKIKCPKMSPEGRSASRLQMLSGYAFKRANRAACLPA